MVRLLALLIAPAVSGLAWTGAGLALGLPPAVTVAAGVLGACGALLATAICVVAGRAPDPMAADADEERQATVVAMAPTRFSRQEERTPRGDRVA